MPNAVYDQAYQSLAALVSDRAASRMLDAALTRVKLTPESVDAASMSELLMGPVLHELEGIFPRAGVQRQLSGLVQTLRPLGKVAPAPPVAMPAAAPAEAPVEASFGAPAATTVAAPGSRAAPLAADTLGQLVQALAQISNVHFVGAFRQTGDCVVSRGDGLNISALREGLMGIQLLEQAQLRSYHLVMKGTQLFVFTVGQDLLALFGNDNVNVGVVHQTLSTLKEEL